MRILFLIDWFEPAYRAGGPIRSISNLVKLLENEYQIFIITGDRDFGETTPLKNILPDRWLALNDAAKIFYASPSKLSFSFIKQSIREINPDYVYCCGLFSKFFTIYPILINKFFASRFKLIIAIQGMLKPSALSFRPFKKSVYFFLMNALRLHKSVVFHASDSTELIEVQRILGEANIVVIPDASDVTFSPPKKTVKIAGSAKIIYVGRIHPIKNLFFLISILFDITHNIELTIVGPIEDELYWNKCNALIQQLPSNVKVIFAGGMPHDDVRESIIANHLFCLPTRGENYGHAIIEALALGRPVLISDCTPWRNLELAGAGWDISLDKRQDFVKAINFVVKIGQEDFEKICINSLKYSHDFLDQSSIKEKYLKLFS